MQGNKSWEICLSCILHSCSIALFTTTLLVQPLQRDKIKVSPPNEHAIVNNEYVKRPWWERYQPVSYKLGSRSGSPEEFRKMVKTCNDVNVRIYADMVINHMSRVDGSKGRGSWGSYYDTAKLHYSAVPYSSTDFHCCNCSLCHTDSCSIQNYHDSNQVRNCRLERLADLKMESQYVREKIVKYFNDLIDLGVSGFRVDAAKHMWPGDLEEIYANLRHLNTSWFPANTMTYIYNEVIEHGGEPISGSEYYSKGLGKVTEFRYGRHLAKAFRKHIPLSHLKSFGETWGMHPSQYAVVFLDNHDNQRGHGGGGSELITFYEHRLYKMVTAFALAWPYGSVRIMSSYRWGFNKTNNTDLGPPSVDGDTIKPVVIKPDGSCDDGSAHTWMCEHRWKQITNMVEWRNIAGDKISNVQHWWDNGGHQIAFSRNNKAFIAINNDNTDMVAVIKTSLPPGIYCDVISGYITKKQKPCSGKSIQVDVQNNVFVDIKAGEEDPVIAIHQLSKVKTNCICSPLPEPYDFSRTVIFIQLNADTSDELFIRGGISHTAREGCANTWVGEDPCSIRIEHNVLHPNEAFPKYNNWRVGDNHLDWYGKEETQMLYNGRAAEGTPLAWTTNDERMPGYHPLNRYGSGYWIADINVNCSETLDGWFELKVIDVNNNINGGWEGHITQKECSGSASSMPPSLNGNHLARCGHINVFRYNSPFCYISDL